MYAFVLGCLCVCNSLLSMWVGACTEIGEQYGNNNDLNVTANFWCCVFTMFFFPLPSPPAVPSPPQNLSYSVQQYGRDNVTLTVQWQFPQSDGGAPVNYTITVSPGVSTFTTNGTSVPVTVRYNVNHNVSIVATNSNGSSSAVILPIRIGMLSSVILPIWA